MCRTHSQRPQARSLGLAVTSVVVGLATRRVPVWFPAPVATYGGDVLWAAMVFWLLGLVWRRAATLPLATAALGIAWAVELSQRWQVPWLVRVRGSPLGALVLGQGFLWSDLWCYLAGVAGAAGIDVVLRRRQPAPSPTSARIREVP